MTIREIFECSRKVDRSNLRKNWEDEPNGCPFESEAILTSDEIRDDVQPNWVRFLDVRSSRKKCFFNYVKEAVGCEIEARVIFSGRDGKNRNYPEEVSSVLHEVEKTNYSHVLQFTNPARFVVVVVATDGLWARYMLTKELSHILTNTVSDRGGVCHDADRLLTDAEDWKKHIRGVDLNLPDEAVGVYCALEVILPWSLRTVFNDLSRQDPRKVQKIAKRFQIPEMVVRHVLQCTKLDRQKTYIDFSSALNRKLDEEEKRHPPKP